MRQLYMVTAQFMLLAYNKDEVYFHTADLEQCSLMVNKASKCLPGWKDAYPLGEPSDLTCDEILKEMP